MVRTAVGLWLTGLAAAGIAVCLVSVSGAAPASAAPLAAWRCNAEDGVGVADRVTYKLKVNGKSIDYAILRAGDELTTDSRGAVDICLTKGKTACRIRNNSSARVLPSKVVLLNVTRSMKPVACEAKPSKRMIVKTPQARIILDPPMRRLFGTDRAAAGPPAVFSIGVGARATVVEVGSGTLLVASADRASNAMVVGRNQRVVVRSGQKPVRKLWGTGRGSFRTRGRFSTATVHG
jgi:hypothetical protein